jgi:peptidoglycan/LPS O-acetylase OafA/YrhL
VLQKANGGLSFQQMIILAFFVLYLASWDDSILLWSAILLLTVLVERNPADEKIARLGWIFANRWSQHLGKISYSIYLSHWLVIMLVLRVVCFLDPHISAAHAARWMFPGVIIVTLLVSHFLYLRVEEPCIRFGKRLFNEE